jgi:hypothetical protein
VKSREPQRGASQGTSESLGLSREEVQFQQRDGPAPLGLDNAARHQRWRKVVMEFYKKDGVAQPQRG